MSIEFTPNGWDDYLFWYDSDQEILDKINDLIKEIKRDAFKGIGKPEPLRGNLAGYWSRRISGEHRLVYRVHGTKPHQVLVIVKGVFTINVMLFLSQLKHHHLRPSRIEQIRVHQILDHFIFLAWLNKIAS